jgi:exodeoxyribonuclease V beta subunit
MAEMKELDLLNTVLEGTSLIEASAGTGKTYAITGLVLRLILECDVPIHQILVVTFTEAATSELKDRIRRRIREAVDVFSGVETDDAFLMGLLDRNGDPASALRKLDFALTDFDQASIFTIHGFCLRTLQEHAFASGILFDAELVTDQESLVREIVQDFWRSHFYAASPLFCEYARSTGMSPEYLHSLVSKNIFNPYLKVIPNLDMPDCTELEARYLLEFESASHCWSREREAVTTLLLESPALKRNMYGPASIPGWAREMDLYLAGECLSCNPGGRFEKFTRSGLERALKKNQPAPAHPFFELCENLRQAVEQLREAYGERVLGLEVEFIRTLREQLEKRKLGKNILFFDDLLVRLERALAEPNGVHLADLVRERFKAALIDEFQDTDSIQYSIFRRIFGEDSSPLFLIGDPKQAIYGFRGADIFSYMEASRRTTRRFTLSENWRSEPNLISGVNTVFSQADRPFIYEEIGFHPARPATAKQHAFLEVDGRQPAPLQVWFLKASEISNGKPIAKDKAAPLIVEAVAAEISRLLDLGRAKRALIGGRAVREGDIAVLVRENREALEIRKSLAALSIHGVLYSTENLFDTQEALEVERLLTAIANPAQERLLRAALTTDLLGVSGEEIGRLMEDEIGWEAWLVELSSYHETWSKFGFLRMFRRLLSEREVLPRLMMLENGERRCTNVLHLSEVLHQSATENGFNISGLLKWLAGRRDEHTPRIEQHQLRLESDENAVKIVTIHKSKGLEYPIVFCPFPWRGSNPGKGPIVFHDESDAMRLTLDLGSPELEGHKALAGKEQLAENLRLLYVAMTRAKNRCTLVWGPFNGAGTSAPAYLFHPGLSMGWDGRLDVLEERFKGVSDDSMWADLEDLRTRGGGAVVRIREMPLGKGRVQPPVETRVDQLDCRRFTANIDRSWGISSFSSLIFKQPHRAELADHDEATLPETAVEAAPVRAAAQDRELSMFSFPKGTASGILLHQIFEELDFTETDPRGFREVVLKALGMQGFDLVWAEPLCEMIRKVLTTNLPSEFGTFSLSRISADKRLTELEFYFPLRRLDGSELTELFSRHLGGAAGAGIPSNLERFRFESVEGFMKGFIDLVFEANGRFYILDWKSNFLGTAMEHYGRDSLQKAMRESLYDLQYTLYCVALHRYLGTRVPDYGYDTHFGEVFYLFLRGIDPAHGPEYGVFRDRPSRESIEALSVALTGG